MKLKHGFFFLLCLIILYPASGKAFVPQTPHLLHLVVQKIKQPSGIEASVTKVIINCDDSGESAETPLDETLMYHFPNRLRSEIVSDLVNSFTIEAGFEFIKVINGETVSREKSPIDIYTDILLYRDHESLLGQLALTGIDVERVSFQRYEDTICWVIGKPGREDQTFAGLWIEKETLLPLRYVVEKDDWMIECRYADWQRISRTWYPMQVTVYLDNQLYARIHVNDISLKSGFSPSLFDIARVETLYPEKVEPELLDDRSDGMDELDRRIEEFKKLYE